LFLDQGNIFVERGVSRSKIMVFLVLRICEVKDLGFKFVKILRQMKGLDFLGFERFVILKKLLIQFRDELCELFILFLQLTFFCVEGFYFMNFGLVCLF
jgi:hypothetical protein